MNTTRILTAALVALLLTACGGSDEPVPDNEDGKMTVPTAPNCAASGVCS